MNRMLVSQLFCNTDNRCNPFALKEEGGRTRVYAGIPEKQVGPTLLMEDVVWT